MRMSSKQVSQSWSIFNICSLCPIVVALEEITRINHFQPRLHSLKSSCHIIAGHGGHVTKPYNLLNVICNPQDHICYSLKRRKLGMPTEQVDNQ